MRSALLVVALLCACGGGDGSSQLAGDWKFSIGTDYVQKGTLKVPEGAGPILKATGSLLDDKGVPSESISADVNAPFCMVTLRTARGTITVTDARCSRTSWSGKATGASFDGAPFAATRP